MRTSALKIRINTLFSVMLLFGAFNLSIEAVVTKDDCLACHTDKGLEAQTKRGKSLNLIVSPDILKGSVHEDLSCTDCHKGDNENVFENVPHGDKPLRIDCSGCHDDIYQNYIKNDTHGKAYANRNPQAPYCSHCHGGHNVLPLSSPLSQLSRMNQPDTCGKCHSEEKLNLQANITKRNLISRYKESVHFKAIMDGKNGPTCSDCHSHHNIFSSASPESTVSRTNLARTCRRCHPNESKAFIESPHGKTLTHGNHDVPNCTTCHGDHDMASLRTRVGDAKTWAATQVCIWCHGNERIMARYGLDTVPVKSYMVDFHGLTQRGTMGKSATCADCHDAHYSLPSSHPGSRMYISNRGATCGKCHGNVSANFAQSFSHRKAMETTGGKIESIVRLFYIILISAAVVGMLGYNFLVWSWAVRSKLKTQKAQKHVKRMSPYELNSHIVLSITFGLLVITGFALKYPEVFWAKWLFAIGMNETVRSLIHRLSAVIMTFDLIFFMFYMFFKKRGKCVLRELLPRKRDFTDFFASVKYYAQGSRIEHRPKYDVFNFGEKFEFWALIWGSAIMALTGIILWFPKAFSLIFPPWVLSVARIIHFYEALLATLAIIIWHGYNTMFHPDEYPMDTSWLTGYITEKEANHRFEGQAIKKMQKNGIHEEEKIGKKEQEKPEETPGEASSLDPVQPDKDKPGK